MAFLLKAYLRILDRRPLLTQSISAGEWSMTFTLARLPHLPDQYTSRHSYGPQTNRDSSNVIGREVLLPRYFPQTLKINSLL